jgi:GAF domain-containing protein
LNHIDVARLYETGGGYMMSSGAYRLINRCTHLIYAGSDIDKALDEVLALIGSYLGVSRIYIFVIDTVIGRNTHEWCAPGISPEKRNMAQFFVSKKWRDTLEKNGLILVSDINQLELKIRAEMSRQHIISMAALPLLWQKKVTGFIGVDECVDKTRRWKPEEIQMLRHLGVLISGILIRFPGLNTARENREP